MTYIKEIYLHINQGTFKLVFLKFKSTKIILHNHFLKKILLVLPIFDVFFTIFIIQNANSFLFDFTFCHDYLFLLLDNYF